MRQFHAHCVCVVGKTTVCRIFSCQISLVVGRWPTRRIRDVGRRGTLDPTPPLSSRPLALSAASKSVSRSLAGPTRPAALPRRRAARALECHNLLLHRLLLRRLRRTHGHQLFGELGVSGVPSEPRRPMAVAFTAERGFQGSPRGGEASMRPLQTCRAGGCRGPSEAARAQCPRFKQSGEYRARTGDLLDANQALSQLS